MDGLTPFGEERRHAIREVARTVIYGGTPPAFVEADYRRYGVFVHGVAQSLSGMDCSLSALPYGGGFMDQPTTTMEAVAVVQEVMSEKIKQDSGK